MNTNYGMTCETEIDDILDAGGCPNSATVTVIAAGQTMNLCSECKELYAHACMANNWEFRVVSVIKY